MLEEKEIIQKNKIWWDWSDGPDKSGRCGEEAPKINGQTPQCDPSSANPCCSEWGFCGSSTGHCSCPKCVDYRKSKLL